MAVLYRTNFQSRQIEEALRRYNRDYVVLGGFSFYQRAEVKDALAYLKAVISPQDSVSLLRIINTPARGIGKSTIEQIEQYGLQHELSVWSAIGRMLEENLFPARAESALRIFKSMMEELGAAAAEGKVDDLLRQILERTGYARMLQADNDPEAESRLGNLNELVNAASEAAERGETIAGISGSRGSGLRHRQSGRARARLAAHAAQRQRSGVSDRVPGRHGRGAVPAHSLARFESRHGRRAAAVLRGHDALREAAVPDVGALSAAFRRRPAGSHHPVAIPARSSARRWWKT